MLRTTFMVMLGGGVVRVGLLLLLLPGGTLLTAALIGTAVGLCEPGGRHRHRHARFEVGALALLRVLWRSLLAWRRWRACWSGSGLGLAAATTAPWRDLLLTAGVGALIYATVTGLAWVAVGRAGRAGARPAVGAGAGSWRRLRGWRWPGPAGALRLR